ncbi:hypothetical protein [Brucella tritici]|uniref:hypothetical protein n=1 Tax=Brucella tritici TaxID=94626 RepID=UPI0020011F2C|nr:hypothetical protein [Brucella tritici]
MSKEHEKQTISELIAKVLAIGPVDGYRTHKEWKGGKLTFTAEPEADDGSKANLKPFTVDEDGVVYIQNATVDYEAINKGVGELMQFLDSRIGTLQNDVLALSAKVAKSSFKDDMHTEVPLFDPRKHVGENFTQACKSWTESIAEATGPSSDTAKTVEHITVHFDAEELYDDLVKSPEFKSVILDALCRSPRTAHIKL